MYCTQSNSYFLFSLTHFGRNYEDVWWLSVLCIDPLLLLSHLVVDLHHVRGEIHATVLEVELEERNRLHRRCTVVAMGLVVVLEA